MAYYDLISENDESTVVAEFEKGIFAAEAPYMSEKNLEDQFVEQLRMQEYVEYLRQKDYCCWHRVPDTFFQGDQWLDDMQPMLLAAKPMMDMMNAVIDDYE